MELGAIGRLRGRLEKLEKGMNLLLAAGGLAAPQEVKSAERLQVQRMGQIASEKRKEAEVGKLKKLEKEEQIRNREEEEARRKALGVINTSKAQSQIREEVILGLHKKVEEVSQKDLNLLPAGEMAEEATRKAKAVEELEKLQKENERENVVEVGNGMTLVREKLHTMVGLIATHNSEITPTHRQLMVDMVNWVNQLQRTTAKAEERVAWEVAAVAGVGARKDKTRWLVKKVGEDIPARSVLARVARDITTYLERSGDFLHAWIERPETVMLVAPQGPAAEIADRMVLQKMLKEENKEV